MKTKLYLEGWQRCCAHVTRPCIVRTCADRVLTEHTSLDLYILVVIQTCKFSSFPFHSLIARIFGRHCATCSFDGELVKRWVFALARPAMTSDSKDGQSCTACYFSLKHAEEQIKKKRLTGKGSTNSMKVYSLHCDMSQGPQYATARRARGRD